MTRASLPTDFLWGATVAGHQVDGFDTHSDTSFLEATDPTPFVEPSGAACNSWELWQTDLDLAASLGLNAFRFSTEWARIEPEPGVLDPTALAHYDAMVDGCLERGMAPVVCLNHFTSPHWFAAAGSWLATDAPERFADFTTRVIERYGDRLAFVVTLNEPNLPRLLHHMGLPDVVLDVNRASLDAASERAGVPRYRLSNVMVPEELDAFQDAMTTAHVAAREALKAVRPELPVGLSVAMADDVAHAGGQVSRDTTRAVGYDHWFDVSRDDDFVGVQNYVRTVHGPEGPLPPRPGRPLNAMGSEIEPDSLGGAVRYAYERSQVPIVVTEHGVGTNEDIHRVAFIPGALASLDDAIRDGVPVHGYFHWTLIDNYEWVSGFDVRFGLYEVDRTTYTRTRKGSADVYASEIRRRQPIDVVATTRSIDPV